jgi:hypothetical protein
MSPGVSPVLVYRVEDYRQSPTGCPRTIVYERTGVPYGSVMPVSPPGSPREGSDEEDDYIPEYDWKYNLVQVRDWVPYITHHETFYRTNQHFSFQKNGKRRNISKNMRRMGRLKQSGDLLVIRDVNIYLQ